MKRSKVKAFIKEASLLSEVSLRPHQEEAVKKTLKRDRGIIFSHPVGSGKTLTGIAAFEALKTNNRANKALVIVPASLRKNFAEQGVKKFTNDDYVIFGNKQEAGKQEHTVDAEKVGPGQTPSYGIVSYDLFRENPEKFIDAHGADTVILDEIHRLKNDSSKVFKTIKDKRANFQNFIGLTGSLVSNTPSDIVPLIDVMTDGKHHLGGKASFESRFVRLDKDGNKYVERPNVVKSLISPYVHHIEKEEMYSQTGAPPNKLVKFIDVPMSTRQSELYRFAIDRLDPITKLKLKSNLGKLSNSELKGVFSKLLKTRQISNSLAAMDNKLSLKESARQTPKIKKVLDDVEEHMEKNDDGQVVIHSNLIQGGLDVIEAGLTDRKIKYGRFIGKGNKGVNEKTRQQDVDDFNAGKKKVLIISAAGGEGLNLPNTTMFASLDGHFNPEKINQAEARGIRAGGLSHRKPKDRNVEIRRYRSILPRSKAETTSNIFEAASPLTYITRWLNNEQVWKNPFKRPDSVDEMVYDIAKQKDHGNEQIRSMLKK